VEQINTPFASEIDLEDWTLALEASGVGFWQWHVSSGAVRLTRGAADLLGLENCSAHLDEIIACLHGEDVPPIRNALQEAALTGNQINVEFRTLSQRGEDPWLRLRGGSRAWPGHSAQFYGLLADVTQQKQTQQRLQDLQADLIHMSQYAALGEMASTLAHEINQPLTAMANYLQGCRMLLDAGRPENAGAIRDAVEGAADQVLRAGQIIRGFRGFLARGEGEHKIENLPKLIEEASALALVECTKLTPNHPRSSEMGMVSTGLPVGDFSRSE
jgi:signal transduction histidine kinase